MPSDDPCTELEGAYGQTLPKRLRRFFESSEHEDHEGKKVAGLPGFASDVTKAVTFDVDTLCEAQDIFTDLYQDAAGAWGVVGVLGELEDGLCLLVADLTQPDVPVRIFEPDEGLLAYAESFEAFLRGLLGEDEPSPVERLQAAYDAAMDVHQRDASAEIPAACERLAAALAPVAADPPAGFDSFARYVGGGYDLLGRLQRKVGDDAGAAASFRAGLDHRSYRAGVSLLELHDAQGDLDALVELGEHLRGYVPWMLDEYVWEHSRRQLVRAYVRRGDERNAVIALHDLRVMFAEYAARREATASDLRALVEGPQGEIAKRALRWFAPATPEPTPDEVARIEDAWARLPRGVQRAAKLAAKVETKDPNVDELGQILRAETLDLRSLKIDDLSFLAAFPRLRRVNLGKNRLRTLRTLPALDSLEVLEVAENELETLDGLAHVPHLVRLHCAENQLTSLAGVEALVELQDLDADDNRISDLGPVGGLRELEKLSIRDNAITDLSPLAGCPRLEDVSCSSNPLERGLLVLASLRWLEDVEDLVDELPDEAEAFWAARRVALGADAPREGSDAGEAASSDANEALLDWWRTLPEGWKRPFRRRVEAGGEATAASLAELCREDMVMVTGKGVTDLEPIRRFERATFVDVSSNELEDLEPLRALTRLRTLNVSDARVSTLAPLASCLHLESLRAARNRITSLAGLEGSCALRELTLTGNAIDDLGALADKIELRSCALGLNAIEDLAPLRGLTKLRMLLVQGNRVRDLGPLARCVALEVLVCFANPGLSGLMALVELPRLRQVHTHCGVPEDELARFRAARPDVDLT